MAYHLHEHRLTYISVPKVACTSLKSYFYEIENGKPFEPYRVDGTLFTIHKHAKSVRFSSIEPQKMVGHRRIAVVRDPWRRVLSCYADKVVHGGALDSVVFSSEQKKIGMVANPSLDNFVDFLEGYCAVSSMIRHHARPLSFYLGENPGFYDRVFALQELPKMIAYVERIIPRAPELRHLNRRTAEKIAPTQEQINRNRPLVESAYREDLELYGEFM